MKRGCRNDHQTQYRRQEKTDTDDLDRGTRPSGSSAQENRSIYRFRFHIGSRGRQVFIRDRKTIDRSGNTDKDTDHSIYVRDKKHAADDKRDRSKYGIQMVFRSRFLR